MDPMLRARIEIPAVEDEPLPEDLGEKLLGQVIEFDHYDPVPATITYAYVASDRRSVYIAVEYERRK